MWWRRAYYNMDEFNEPKVAKSYEEWEEIEGWWDYYMREQEGELGLQDEGRIDPNEDLHKWSD